MMTLDDLKERILNNTGILEPELPQGIMEEISTRSLSCINNYYPIVTPGTTGQNGVIRTYEDQWRTGYSDPYGLNLWPIGITNWDLNSLDNDPSTANDFYDIAIAYAQIMVGKKRATVSMAGFPYDLKGEQMVQEGQQLLDQMILSFTNRFRNAV